MSQSSVDSCSRGIKTVFSSTMFLCGGCVVSCSRLSGKKKGNAGLVARSGATVDLFLKRGQMHHGTWPEDAPVFLLLGVL